LALEGKATLRALHRIAMMTPFNAISALAIGLLIGLLLAPITAFLGAWLAF